MWKWSSCLRLTGLVVMLGLVACSGSTSDITTPPGASPPTSGPDTLAPTVPAGLNGVPVSSSAIALSWSAAQDNVGVSGYRLYRGTTLIATLSATHHQDSGLTANTTYAYKVQAVDAAGNRSAESAAIQVATMVSGTQLTLAELAASMQAGTWAELSTNNLLPTLTQSSCGATGSIFPYSEDAVWDPVSRRVFFIGSDHIYLGDCPGLIGQHFISYTESDNSWSTLTNAPWFSHTVAHGYDHSAIDVAHGIYYHYPYGDSNRGTHRYDIASGTWLSDTTAAPTRSCCVGVEYFPEFVGNNTQAPAGGLVLAGDGNVYVHRTSSNAWTGALSSTRLNFGEFHNVAEYNPVHKVVIFGGGENYSPYQIFQTLYKLAADGSITPLTSAPFALRVNLSIVTVDPVSGDYLVFGPNGEFYVYNVTTDTWSLQADTPPFASPRRDNNANAVDLTVATPISTYGVVMFVKHLPGNNAKVYLYKHQ